MEECCGALAGPLLQVVGDAARSRAAASSSQHYRVREVAALQVQRVIDALRRAERAEGTPLEHKQALESVRVALSESVTRRLAFESKSTVRKVLQHGAEVAAELNSALVDGEGAADEDEGRSSWAATEAAVKTEIEAQLQALEQLQEQASAEPDPLKKSELLVRARVASASLAKVSENVKDVGTALKVRIRKWVGARGKGRMWARRSGLKVRLA